MSSASIKKYQPPRTAVPHEQNRVLPEMAGNHPRARQWQAHGEQWLGPLPQPALAFMAFAARETTGQSPHPAAIPAIRPTAAARICGTDKDHIAPLPPSSQPRTIGRRALADPHRNSARAIQAAPIGTRGRFIDRPQPGHDRSSPSPNWSLRWTQADISRPKPNITVSMAEPP